MESCGDNWCIFRDISKQISQTDKILVRDGEGGKGGIFNWGLIVKTRGRGYTPSAKKSLKFSPESTVESNGFRQNCQWDIFKIFPR